MSVPLAVALLLLVQSTYTMAEGASSSCCSLHTKLVPVDTLSPTRLFSSPLGGISTDFEMNVCVNTCQTCTCTPGESIPVVFTAVLGGEKLTRNVPTSCDSQCPPSKPPTTKSPTTQPTTSTAQPTVKPTESGACTCKSNPVTEYIDDKRPNTLFTTDSGDESSTFQSISCSVTCSANLNSTCCKLAGYKREQFGEKTGLTIYKMVPTRCESNNTCIKQQVAHKDIECRPELSYFFLFGEDGRTLLTTQSKSVAQTACRKEGGQLTADRYYSTSSLEKCYATLLQVARLYDLSINTIRTFGAEEAATGSSIVVCQRPHRICPEFGVAAAVPANVNFVKLYTYAEAKTKCEAHGMQLLQKTDINNPLAGLCGRYLADEVVPLFDVSVWDQNDAEKFGSKRGVICENLSWKQ